MNRNLTECTVYKCQDKSRVLINIFLNLHIVQMRIINNNKQNIFHIIKLYKRIMPVSYLQREEPSTPFFCNYA